MSHWFRVLLAAAFVLSLGVAAPSVMAADKEPPKKDEKKDDKKGDDKKPEEKKKDPKDMTTDEREAANLCIIEPTKSSKPVYHADYKDKTYHFCCRDHQKQFAADPAKYVKDAPKK